MRRHAAIETVEAPVEARSAPPRSLKMISSAAGGRPSKADQIRRRSDHNAIIGGVDVLLSSSMASHADLQTFYRTYIEAINALPTSTLDPFLAPQIIHNDKRLSPTEYRALILDQSTFAIEDLVIDEHAKRIAARLSIEVGLGARRIKENVFYSLNADGCIQQVWSMVEDV